MAKVGTFLQLVSWFVDSKESLVLLHDPVLLIELEQDVPRVGSVILVYQSLGPQILNYTKIK